MKRQKLFSSSPSPSHTWCYRAIWEEWGQDPLRKWQQWSLVELGYLMGSLSFGMSTSSLIDEAKGHGGLFQCSFIITEFFCITKQNPRFFHISLLPSPKSYQSMTHPSCLYLCSILVNYSKWVGSGSCAKVPLQPWFRFWDWEGASGKELSENQTSFTQWQAPNTTSNLYLYLKNSMVFFALQDLPPLIVQYLKYIYRNRSDLP